MTSTAQWAAIAAISALWLLSCSSEAAVPATAPVGVSQSPQKVTARHLDSAPMHGQTFAQVPEKVLINFVFSLADASTITVTKDGVDLRIGAAEISGSNSLGMSSTLPGDAGDGVYVVKYVACRADRSCHEDQFTFTVDNARRSTYVDMTGQSEVVVDMKGLKFEPARIVVSRGTKVTWINGEASVHFVNSDPHPSHNNLASLNSFDLKQGESHSYTFDEAGEWAYHCSAHFPQGMVGSVLVQ